MIRDEQVSALYSDSLVQEAGRILVATRFNVAVLDTLKMMGGYGYPGTLEVLRWIQH